MLEVGLLDHLDLAILAAVLAAAKVVPPAQLAGTVLLGELDLDGRWDLGCCS